MVDTELLPNTFRFYKDNKNGTTELVSIYEKFFEFLEDSIRQKLEKEFSEFEKRLDKKIHINLNMLGLDELEFLEKQDMKFNKLTSKKAYLEKNNKDGRYNDLIKKCDKVINEFCNGNYKTNIDIILEEIFTNVPKIKEYIKDSPPQSAAGKAKIMKMFEENDKLIPSLFANGVILVERMSELLSLPILIRKFEFDEQKYNSLEKHNIEIINVRGKDGFNKYMKLMDSLKISYCVICDGDTAFNFYTENDEKNETDLNEIKSKLAELLSIEEDLDILKEKIKEIINNGGKDEPKYIIGNMPKILENIKEIYQPEWLNDEYINKIKEKLELQESIKDKEELVNKCITLAYNHEIGKKLREEFYIYACPYYDWTDFLKEEFSEVNIPNINGKAEIAYIIAMNVSEELVNEKLKNLKQFIKKLYGKM